MDIIKLLFIIIIVHIIILSIGCMFAFNIMVGIFVLTIPTSILSFLYVQYKPQLDELSKPTLPFQNKKSLD
ncbi:hypothetical protein KM1_048170 [Entamoeba histolytica HM-3:IMSS]|uniref:Uncharacterized protein n=1 Tax=Entamoeba histolytica HM-3:IMSS TaxID=885315 RepID=M7WUT6_ENTHI|nr:hypothetical protein KM1_048170 [Entamoeba histolytica HM-3:IMSS]